MRGAAELDPAEGLVGDTWNLRGSSGTADGSPDPAAQITLMSSRVILDSLAAQVRSGKLGNKAAAQDRPAWGP